MPENIKRAAQTLVHYTYLWDGTKVRAVDDSGRGYEYIGSLRFAVGSSGLTPESLPFSAGRIVATSSGFEPKYYVTDHLGSTRVIVNQNGSTSEAVFDYMPYGTQHRVAASPTSDSDFRFTGKELQGLFGLDELYDSAARFQANNGRFLSVDPLAGDFPWCSPYTYCAGNPINLIDPDGRESRPNAAGELWDMFTDRLKKMFTFNIDGSSQASMEQSKQQIEQNIADIEAATEAVNMVGDGATILNPIGGIASVAGKKAQDEQVSTGDYAIAAIEIIPAGKIVKGGGSAAKVAKTAAKTTNRAASQAKGWLGVNYKVITNKAGDNIFMSKDGLRKIRFDIKNPHGDSPHIHLEKYSNGKWRDAIPVTHRIYPKP